MAQLPAQGDTYYDLLWKAVENTAQSSPAPRLPAQGDTENDLLEKITHNTSGLP